MFKYKKYESNYDIRPKIKINKSLILDQDIINTISKLLEENNLICIDCYPGVDYQQIRQLLNDIPDINIIFSNDFIKPFDDLWNLFSTHISDDRVFGKMYYGDLINIFDKNAINTLKQSLNSNKKTIIYGVGATLISDDGINIFVDITRWEIQKRYRKGLSNIIVNNPEDDKLKKFKIGYFIEWRIADKHKITNFNKYEYIIDGNNEKLKMIAVDDYKEILNKTVSQPFRTVPYFDEGVWGGQWLKEVCSLDKNKSNYAWCFDGVPEENSILYQFDNEEYEIPAINLVLLEPLKLLGDKVYAMYGAEYPIRFDILDTMEGQNLSLQVHPTTEYIKKTFGMSYTQNESYYILDCKEDTETYVYLGVKNDVNKDDLFNALSEANKTNQFDADKYINKIKVKKGDHLLIPAGTCHGSGKDNVVLEISSTPYIFTFKLWDWNRVDKDGKPRPIHLNHGKQVLNDQRNTDYVYNKLVNNIKVISNDNNILIEDTGLHELEFIKTIRYSFNKEIIIENNNKFSMLNLVSGDSITIQSLDNTFEDFTVHFAETFIIPANVKKVKVVSNEDVELVRAYVNI